MGMAVDANVLVFERIREEIANGRSPINAVDAGYQRAWTTIVDSNLTTLFAVMFLYALGSGPVNGVAVLLGVCIIASIFTPVMVPRRVTVNSMHRRRPSVLPISIGHAHYP